MATEPLVVRAMYYGGNDDEPLVPVEEGATLELRLPPQGGFVLWIAPEVEGASSEQLEVHTLVRSAATSFILAEERRSVGGGTNESGIWRVMPVGIRNVNNVPVCPNYGDELLVDTDVVLEVTVQDLDVVPVRRGKLSLRVRLTCPTGSKACPCECSVGYALGGCPDLDVPPP